MNARKLKKELVLANQEQSFALYEQQYALLDGIFEPTRRGEPLHYREIIGIANGGTQRQVKFTKTQ